MMEALVKNPVMWVMNHPTPQMTPLLNDLCQDLPHLRVYYHSYGSLGRGWGDLGVTHHSQPTGRTSGWRGLLTGITTFLRVKPAGLVIFGYGSTFNMGVLIAARLRGTPVAIRSDSSWSNEKRKPALLRLSKLALLRALLSRRHSVAWVIGKDNALYWRNYAGLRTTLIPFESPVKVSPTDCTNSTALAKSDKDLPVILYVGRLEPEKGIALLAETQARLVARGSRHVLRVIGSGSELYRLTDLPQVEIVGSKSHSELEKEFRAATVLVVPSEMEAWGLVVLEALQFGLPVVATVSVPAARELCDEGWNLTDRSPELLADALQTALKRQERWPLRQPVNVLPLYRHALAELDSDSPPDACSP